MSPEDGTLRSPGSPEGTDPLGSRGDLFDPACPTRRLLDRIGSKWTAMIVIQLHDASPEELRFSELKRRAAGVSQKMLAQTLRSLEQDTLVSRRVEATTPPRVHYRLTELGESLYPPIAALREWAESNMRTIDRPDVRDR
ncbi:HxlR family transcriptional regulator [Plantibacter sp. H53]|uniref:winged helix-turn-helix transcriptional regulator n=1 Tax=Plantibacter sp. H53 TaxID=1827323 RepID=UPI0007D9C93B|nr:helix-turn-helix domain-containing protein [Plantibacter sp. H53]OAN35837.1 HxlR family transcriptional regulator [Plantibacter sp. H53]